MSHVKVGSLPLDAAVYISPDPGFAYRLYLSHGFDACAERWGWLDRAVVGRLINVGRGLAGGGRSAFARRELPAEVEARIVEDVFELGGVSYAAQANRVSERLVRTLLIERGHRSWPKASRSPVAVAAARMRMAAVTGARA